MPFILAEGLLQDLGIEHIGDAGVAVALIIMLIIVAVIGYKLTMRVIDVWLVVSNARNQTDKTQNDILQELSDRLEQEKEQRRADAQMTQALLTAIETLSMTIVHTQEQMQTITANRNRKLEAIHTDVKVIPNTVWEIGDPKLDTIRQLLETYLEKMEKRITDRIDPHAESARQAVAGEVGTIRTQIETVFASLLSRLNDIDSALQHIEKKEVSSHVGPTKSGTG